MKPSTMKVLYNETPFAVIDFNGVEIRQYWTGSNKNTYGFQVLTCIFFGTDFYEESSTGCGYCKASQGLELAFRHLGKIPKGHGHDRISHKYHVGGNFYKVPNKDIRKFK